MKISRKTFANTFSLFNLIRSVQVPVEGFWVCSTRREAPVLGNQVLDINKRDSRAKPITEKVQGKHHYYPPHHNKQHHTYTHVQIHVQIGSHTRNKRIFWAWITEFLGLDHGIFGPGSRNFLSLDHGIFCAYLLFLPPQNNCILS